MYKPFIEMKKIMSWALLALLFGAISSCKDDDPKEEEEAEVITTLNYTLTPTSGDVVTLSFSDPDGDGGNAPTITGGTLQAGMTYTGSMDLLNESGATPESITEEIEEEDLEHQFFFWTGGNLDLTVAYADQDSAGNPLGLATTITTGAASDGTLTVVLRHEPDKSGTGVSGGDITNAGGETDIEVEFPVTIQ